MGELDMKRILLVALVGLVVSGPALAQSALLTGNVMLKFCTSKSEKKQSLCIWYLKGFLDAEVVLESFGATTLPYCVPAQVTLGQKKALFVKHLQANPEKWHLMAGSIFAFAMIEKFPCKKVPKK
jgi:hypothetical protein